MNTFSTPPNSFAYCHSFGYQFAVQTNNPNSSIPSGACIGAFCNNRINESSTTLAGLLHEGPPINSYDMNPIKGNLTESLMEKIITKGFLRETGQWVSGTPSRIGNTGIDGLFFRTDRFGNICDLLVEEAKYGSSQLGMTASGRQMSKSWIKPRLNQTKNLYANLAKELNINEIHQMSKFAMKNANNIINTPLKNNGKASIWKTKNGFAYYSENSRLRPTEIIIQAKRVAQRLQLSANGKLPYKARIIRYDSIGNQHRITIQSLDQKTGKCISKQVIRGEFSQLPKNIRKVIHQGLKRYFNNSQLADLCCSTYLH